MESIKDKCNGVLVFWVGFDGLEIYEDVILLILFRFVMCVEYIFLKFLCKVKDWEWFVIFLVIKLVFLRFKIKISDKDKKKGRYSFLDIVIKCFDCVRIFENLVINLECEIVFFV